jgi:hypothetical protein
MLVKEAPIFTKKQTETLTAELKNNENRTLIQNKNKN